MYYIIDRFEGEFAVCEGYEDLKKDPIGFENIKKTLLPKNVKESDVFRTEGEIFIFCKELTEIRKKEFSIQFKSLFKKNKN